MTRTEEQKEKSRQASARYRAAHPEKVKVALQVWRHNNPERIKEYERRRVEKLAANPELRRRRNTAWQKANPEKYKARQGAWREANQQAIRDKVSKWAAANPDRAKANLEAWRAANPERGRELGRKAAAARRARKAGAMVVEKVDLVVLGDRDNWMCGICDCPVDKSLRWPDQMSASHDHIIALVNGGDHSYANAQLAHVSCNRRKYVS